MSQTNFPTQETLTICFAHSAYQMATLFERRQTEISHAQAWAPDDFRPAGLASMLFKVRSCLVGIPSLP